MFKNLLMPLVLGFVFASVMCCSVGCGGPGEVIEGTATNANFGESGDKDTEGRQAPGGLGVRD